MKDLKEKLKKPEVKEMEVQAGWGPGEGREMMARPTERQKEAEQQAEQAKAAKQPRAQQPQQVQAQKKSKQSAQPPHPKAAMHLGTSARARTWPAHICK
ncbi:hypothetical protein [Candidatus Hydrogenosomobacter endosymbioticus]|uniref:Uncharacterized protein n=1 Tax=Candidatus Hydrogenosomobacter endosymbioticus TaxID=2558174 RepID=A0ABM7V8H9_9PROT|nr:hypothetical protein [Candidatus Hydrogenosomobacter endosymbioticus]BDB96079.1 hypothetical protein HYD_2120 [Candidatus Hydrogenosomobacter endosymbioticus]